MRARAAALAVERGRILLARHVKDGRTSYLLPGGGVADGETAADALARELREEAGVGCVVGDLRFVVEAVAPDRSRHILQLVFAVELLGRVGASTDPRVAACAWHRIEELRTLPFLPAFGDVLADHLTRSGTSPCRFIRAEWKE